MVIEQDDPEIFVAFSSDNGSKEAFKFIVSSAHIRLAETDRNEEEGIWRGSAAVLFLREDGAAV